jgi:AraC-like DNA-binding protein
MNEHKYILFFFGALGVFNGLILGIYFLFFPRKKSLSTFFLGCMLMALTIRIGKSVFVYFNPGLAKIYLQIGLSACFLIGPSLFFFTKATIEQPARLPRSWKIHIAALLAILVIAGIPFPYATYPELWGQYFIRIIYAVWLVYIVASGIQLKHLLPALFKTNTGIKASEKWLLVVFFANVVIYLSFMLALFGHLGKFYFGGALIFSVILYSMICVHLYKRKADHQFYGPPAKKPHKKTNDPDAAALVQKLEDVMTGKELYKNPNLSLGDLAKAVNVSGHQLSQVLNDILGKNFTSYINEYRINEACRMMAANHPFSLEAMGYEVGFNSKSTFYTAFKKIKATTPLLYKEGLAKQRVR